MQKMLPATTNVGPIEFRVTTRLVLAPVETALDDIIRPGFWAHVASKIQPGNHLVVRREDMAWQATLLVTETGPGLVIAHMLHEPWINPNHKQEAPTADNTATPLEAPPNYTINHAPKTGWRV